jgi:hypothetical protein
VTRVEIKAIDPPKSVIDAMEKQMRAEREKRAAILNAEGVRQAQILTADGDKQGNVLRAEGEKQSAILKAEGQAQAIGAVFQSIHDNDPDPKLLAYQYLQTLPQLAQGPGNTVWMVPSELTGALKMLSSAFGGAEGADGPAAAGGSRGEPAADGQGLVGRRPRTHRDEVPAQAGPPELAGAAPAAAAAETTSAATAEAAAELAAAVKAAVDRPASSTGPASTGPADASEAAGTNGAVSRET